MKEFGSDFHTITKYNDTGNVDITRIIRDATYLADGRLGLIAVIRQEGWQRLWVPEYFCYEVLESIEKHTDIKLMYYEDFPGQDSHEMLKLLPFEEGDALLRMNYFGLVEYNTEESFDVPVIEDHSHDLLNRWSLFSDAEWCIASLRKTLPIAEGGIVWSPKGKILEKGIVLTSENESLAEKRWKAMDLKEEFLGLESSVESSVLKDQFRKLYIETEEELDYLQISAIDKRGMDALVRLDINMWYNQKKKNWQVLTSTLDESIHYLSPNGNSCTPFSLVLKCDNSYQREKVRIALIKSSIYPAMLWHVPDTCSKEVKKLSDCLLSVHCDGRYTEGDMNILAEKINKIYRTL